ncbi:MAG: hypothetical protein CMJ57_09185 [Planctomycetaceae bacterium]|nr:hypothetical protein [Planctomycetaceae bacterium]
MIEDFRQMILNGTSDIPVSPYLRADTTLPAVVYDVQSEEIERTLAGSTAVRTTRVELRALAATYAAADTLGESVVSALAGAIVGSDIKGVETGSVARDFEETVDGQNLPLYVYEIDGTVYWEKS